MRLGTVQDILNYIVLYYAYAVTALHRTTGKYRLEGSQRRRCVGGHFDGEETRCVGLNQKYDYKIDQVIDIMRRRMVT